MLTATFCRAALSHMFVIRPNIADLGFSQVFAKGRTTSTLQVWTFVVFVLTVLKYEQNTWFQIIMAWYDISSRFDQNCGLWLIESWKSSPTFGWNDQLTIIKGGDLLKQCHSFVDWWESTCSYIAQIVGPRPPLIQMSTNIRGANLEQRGGSRSPPPSLFAFTWQPNCNPWWPNCNPLRPNYNPRGPTYNPWGPNYKWEWNYILTFAGCWFDHLTTP